MDIIRLPNQCSRTMSGSISRIRRIAEVRSRAGDLKTSLGVELRRTSWSRTRRIPAISIPTGGCRSRSRVRGSANRRFPTKRCASTSGHAFNVSCVLFAARAAPPPPSDDEIFRIFSDVMPDPFPSIQKLREAGASDNGPGLAELYRDGLECSLRGSRHTAFSLVPTGEVASGVLQAFGNLPLNLLRKNSKWGRLK